MSYIFLNRTTIIINVINNNTKTLIDSTDIEVIILLNEKPNKIDVNIII